MHTQQTERIALPRRLVPRPATRPAGQCAMIINGERLLVDVNIPWVDPARRHVVIDAQGQMSVQYCEECEYTPKPYGARTAMGLSRPSSHGGLVRECLIVVGAVVASEDYPQ